MSTGHQYLPRRVGQAGAGIAGEGTQNIEDLSKPL
jgi:hypothetical protein